MCITPEIPLESCDYRFDPPDQALTKRPIYTAPPITGYVKIECERKGGVSDAQCSKLDYQTGLEKRRLCACKTKDIWPGTVSEIKFKLLHPPKQRYEYAAITFSSQAGMFTVSTKSPLREAASSAVSSIENKINSFNSRLKDQVLQASPKPPMYVVN